MSNSVQAKLDAGPMFDEAIVKHGFADNMRDYEVHVDVVATNSHDKGSHVASRYRYTFTHCVQAEARTVLTPDIWKSSWDAHFLNSEKWKDAGEPAGFVWGVAYQVAYPGLKYVKDSALARQWSERLGRPMHEVTIETNVQEIHILFHDVVIEKIPTADETTNKLTFIRGNRAG